MIQKSPCYSFETLTRAGVNLKMKHFNEFSGSQAAAKQTHNYKYSHYSWNHTQSINKTFIISLL